MIAALILVALVGSVLAVAVAFAWQERRRFAEGAVVYGVEDALDYVTARLGEETAARVGRADVRRILEWEMRYLQDPSLHHQEGVAVVGGLDAAGYTQEQALAQGFTYDASVIIEVLDLQAEYLAALGAVGAPVDAEERRHIVEQHEE